ncbi:MAG: amidohydrolase [Aureispira sp.]
MTLHITLLQEALHWENPSANVALFTEKIAALPTTDVIILPEMFSTGFSMNTVVLAEEAANSPTLQWMQEQAQLTQAVLTGSLIIKEAGHYYNRLYWVTPEGKIQYYNKKHLFTMAKEEQHYTSGNQRLIVDYKGWRIALFVCYDLRFPVWNRNAPEHYDLAIYVANWPAKRAHHWSSLLMARAIENQAYVAAVNIVGVDGKGFEYSGDSSIIDPAGTLLAYQSQHSAVLATTLSKEHLAKTRQQFPFLQDQDDFELLG